MGFASFHSIFHIQSKFQVDTNITRVNKLYLLIIKSEEKKSLILFFFDWLKLLELRLLREI